MSEDEVVEKVREFGFKLRNKGPEEIYGVHTDQRDDGTSISFKIDSEKKMDFKTLSVMKNYNGEDIDEIFEQNIKVFLEAANMDLKGSLLAEDTGDSRMINLYLSSDNIITHDAVVYVYIHNGLLVYGYSLNQGQQIKN